MTDDQQIEPRPWQVLARRMVYDSSGWIDLQLVDVRLPDGKILPNLHFLDYKFSAVGIIPVADDGRILLIDHYRFQTDTRGWETPAGKIDEGELPAQTAARELKEETGHVARSFDYLGQYYPSQGSSNQLFHIFIARGVRRVGEIEDTNEVMGLKWFTLQEIRQMITRNEIRNGATLTGLCWVIARGEL
jgi:8-oxo-dGDP phosphatase